MPYITNLIRDIFKEVAETEVFKSYKFKHIQHIEKYSKFIKVRSKLFNNFFKQS